MSEDRDQWADEQEQWSDAEPESVSDLGDAGSDAAQDEYPLLSLEAFENELEALAVYDGEPPTGEVEPETEQLEAGAAERPAELEGAPPLAGPGTDIPAVGEEDRLRQPRAQRFRRGLRNQIGMLPLALYLLALGGFLLARGQDVSGLPEFSDRVLGFSAVLAVSFTLVFHALVSGRRERGLLFFGLWALATVGLVAALNYGLDEDLDLETWWPVGLWSAGPALLLTYVIDRAHDARLVVLCVMALVAGTVAYGVTSDRISAARVDQVAEYWPLLLTVLGVGLLPLVIRRRLE